MTETRTSPQRDHARGSATTSSSNGSPSGSTTTRGFTPSGRRRNRIALGVLLAAIAIGGNAWIYSTLDDKQPVVQVVIDVPAGAQITADMLRTVDVDADPTVNLVDGDGLESLVGQYARVRLVSGSLVAAASLQSQPLVAPGSAVVAIQVPDGTLPIGLRERVPVLLVISPDRVGAEASSPISVPGRVVGLPVETNSALGTQSLSVEVAEADAPVIAAADDVRVVLLQPAADPADLDDEGAEDQGAEDQAAGDQGSEEP